MKEERPTTHGFFDKAPEHAAARATFLKTFLGGFFMAVIVIFAIFPIFWGALWKTPVYNLSGWIVDFDGGLIGQTVTQALTTPNALTPISWTVISAAQFPGGPQDVGHAVLEEKTWVAVTVNAGSSARLLAAFATPNPGYDGSQAITIYGAEARNEGAFRGIIVPSVQMPLLFLSQRFSMQVAQRLANSTNLPSVLASSPQTVSAPVSFTLQNLAPFDQPIASGVIFVGLLFQLIVSLFVVMAGFAARERTGLVNTLTFRSLMVLRFVSLFTAFFILSLLYSLLSMAFQLKYTRKFGDAGFVIFWMLNYVNMLAVGLAVDALVTILPLPAVPFFIILFIICNVAVSPYPIEILPIIYRYGYAMPFYNVSRGIRTVLFATKNRVGLSFGILIAWIVLSLITIPLFQWIKRRQARKKSLAGKERSVESELKESEPRENEPKSSSDS